MLISQIVGISEGCDQNGDRVSKNDKSCHICIMRLKGVLVKYEKYGTLSMYFNDLNILLSGLVLTSYISPQTFD